jgi:hypothetical protein
LFGVGAMVLGLAVAAQVRPARPIEEQRGGVEQYAELPGDGLHLVRPHFAWSGAEISRDPSDARRDIEDMTLMKRLGRPEEIAAVIAYSSHCALLFASRPGLWDLSCWSSFRHGPPDLVAVEQPQGFVQPLPTPSLPAEALMVPGPRHVAPL